MTEHDALFVVFRRPMPAESRAVPRVTRTTLATVDGPWRVTFAPDLGAPPSIVMPQLASWTTSADSGVKYFSGTATYSRTVPSAGVVARASGRAARWATCAISPRSS